MIRIVLGSALPILGLGLAAATLTPDLVIGPRGAPLVMASPEEAKLEAATFDGKACGSALIFSDTSSAPGTDILAFAERSGTDEIVAVEDFSGGAGNPPKIVVLVFDADGHLVAAGDPASLHLHLAGGGFSDCLTPPKPDALKPV